MKLTVRKLSCGIWAVSLVMAMLFTGNRVVGAASSGAPPEFTPAPEENETVSAMKEEKTPVKSRMRPEPTQPTAPADHRPERLASAAADMQAGSIFVYDGAMQKMLCCAGEATEKLYPASITKLFSAWVALQHLDPEAVITAGDELEMVRPGSSTAYIRRGCRLTVRMLVEGMLIPSGNDAAYVLAAAAGRAVAGDENLDGKAAVAVFVEEMNREAEELGLLNSHFENPDGYHHEDHYSCPEDVARIGLLALQEPMIAGFAGLQQDSVVFESGQWITWYSTNALLDPDSKYYTPLAVGLKTGYTGEAGYCLLAAFETQSGYLLVGIFDAESKDSRYADALTLLRICQ